MEAGVSREEGRSETETGRREGRKEGELTFEPLEKLRVLARRLGWHRKRGEKKSR